MKKKSLRINSLLFVFVLMSILTNAQAPYASYPLDGNADDTSYNNLDGVVYGSPTATTNRFNQAGKALNFNGTSDYITLPSSFDFATKTISVWFNPTVIGGNSYANVVYDSDHPGLINGLIHVQMFDDGTYKLLRLDASLAGWRGMANTDFWYHGVIVRTPSLVKYYVNGSLIYSAANPGTAKSNSGNASAVLGVDRSLSNNRFQGKIDDLLIYNYALTDEEVKQLYFGSDCAVTDTTHVTVSTSVTDTLYINTELGVGSNHYNILKAYPNPTKNHLLINTGDYASMAGYTLKISNALSQDVFVSPINQQQFDIDLNTWTGPGTYVVYIINPALQVVATKKIIIQ